MRVTRKSCAPRVVTRRIVSMLAVVLLTALFAIIGPLAKPSYAESVTWDGDKLFYEGNEFKREQPNPLPPGDSRGRAGEVAYTWIETLSNGDKKAHTVFFENDSRIQAKDTAILIKYDYTPPSTYSNPSTPETLTTKANLLGEQVDNEEEGVTGSSCSGNFFSGLGWVLCPASNLLSGFVDGFYDLVKQFLEVPPLLSTGDTSGIYDLWKIMRTISNVAFVIAFIVIIYSQLTSIGISNYNIKTMLPRLIIAAILVNLSYWICALAIDASNLVGHSLQTILVGIRENISVDNIDQLSWGGVTDWLMAGGAGALAYGSFALTPVVSGSLPAIGFLLLSALISAAFALFVAFVILAARQAIITVLVIISPLAFVAYILPNTEEYFGKWRKSLMSLLLFFPVFSLLFGGSQLAGLAIMQSGINNDEVKLHIMVLGLAVQIVPLVITPLLIKFSSGLLGTIANMANSSKHGPLDRMKNWANSNAEYMAGKKRAEIAKKLSDPDASKSSKAWNRLKPGYLGMKAEQRSLKMEAAKSENAKYLSDRAEEERQRMLERADGDARGKPWSAAERSRARHRERLESSADLSETSGRFKSAIEGRGKNMAAARLDALDEYGNKNKYFDEELHQNQRRATATAQSTAMREGRWDAILQDWKAGKSGYDLEDYDELDDDLKTRLRGREATDAASRINELTFQTAQQEKRKGSADTVIKDLETKRLKEDRTAKQRRELAYAGGVDEQGHTKVMARANAEAGALHMKNVEAVNSVYSNEAYSAEELLWVKERGELRGGKKASELEVHAAMQRLMVDVGNNIIGEKLIDTVAAKDGMTLSKKPTYTDSNGNTVTTGSYIDNEQNLVGTGVVNDPEVVRRRESMQILRDSIKKSGLTFKYVSQTELTNMEQGLFISQKDKTKSEELIIYDAVMAKYDEQRIATTDPDELMRMVQVFRNEDNRLLLTPQQRLNIVEKIRAAQSNENYTIKPREFSLMNTVASYLDDTDTGRDNKHKENVSYVINIGEDGKDRFVQTHPDTEGAIPKRANARAANEYDTTRQMDIISGVGLHPAGTDYDVINKWNPPGGPILP